MKINAVWIVTKPGPLSELLDICFKARLKQYDIINSESVSLRYQYLGGLDSDPSSIIDSVWTTEKEAMKRAKKLLKDG